MICSMNAHSSPPNWVFDRAKCTVDLAFRALAEIIDRDVDEANALPDDIREGYTFEVERKDEGLRCRIQVSRVPPLHSRGYKTAFVLFEKSERCIQITGDHGGFKVLPLWNREAATCELQIEGVQHQAWQVSQRALDRLFFDFSDST